jgi:hypothetical protein
VRLRGVLLELSLVRKAVEDAALEVLVGLESWEVGLRGVLLELSLVRKAVEDAALEVLVGLQTAKVLIIWVPLFSAHDRNMLCFFTRS